MRADELIERLQALLRRPVDGVVLRRAVGGRLMAHRLEPHDQVNLAAVFDLVALVPVTPALLVSAPAGGAASAAPLTPQMDGGTLAHGC